MMLIEGVNYKVYYFLSNNSSGIINMYVLYIKKSYMQHTRTKKLPKGQKSLQISFQKSRLRYNLYSGGDAAGPSTGTPVQNAPADIIEQELGEILLK